jgi:glycosyltransferase involved in cell wall biosynthesis
VTVWRSQGGVALARNARRWLAGWQLPSRIDCDLLAWTDGEIPERVAVGRGNLLFVSGACFHPVSRVRRLSVVLNGVAHDVAASGLARPDVFAAHFPQRDPRGFSFASGFWALVPLPTISHPLRTELHVQATLRNGNVCGKTLGVITLEPRPADPVTRPAHGPTPAPRIAICMATYNPPLELFARQVQSIRDQTLDDWVCVVSDDGSRPAAIEGIRDILGKDPRFSLHQSPARLGFYRNFERALSLAPRGVEFVALSDHDDRWHPDKLESLLARFDDETSLVYSDMNIIDETGTVRSTTYWTTRPNRYDSLASLLLANTITGAASMFRARLLEYLLPFPQKLGDPFHDHWLASVALSTGRVAYVDRPLYDYVQHSSNVLGHYAPARGSARATATRLLRALSPGGSRARLRSTLAGWSVIYYGDVLRVKLLARVLQLRCGALLGGDKARAVGRLARLDESWGPTLWLGLRMMVGLGRVTETVHAERVLLRGLSWGRYARWRAWIAPKWRVRRALAAGSGRPERAAARVLPAVAQVDVIRQKIAPLRLRISPDLPARVNLLIPTIDFTYFFGGYIAKFNLARRLAELGSSVRLVAVDPCPDQMAAWRRQVKAYQGLEHVFDTVSVFRAFDRTVPLDVSPADSFIATTWWTAHIAHHAAAALGRRRFVYLIQEYEPYTFPMGSFAALARESYDFPHYAVFSTELLRDHFRDGALGVFGQGPQAGERDSVSFENAITPVGPVTLEELAGRTPRRLLFYARPEAHATRNMFELGVLGLASAIESGCFEGPWEFHGAGAVNESGRVPLGAGVSMRLWPRQSQAEYRELLRRHDLGLSLMYTPHPSLVPIEMASAGMLVVTNTFGIKTADRLAAISRNLIAVEPTVSGVARGLRHAAEAIGDYGRRLAGSRVKWSTSWEDSFTEGVMKRIVEFVTAAGR